MANSQNDVIVYNEDMDKLAELHYGEYMKWFSLEEIDRKHLGCEEGYEDELVIIFKEKDTQMPKPGMVKNGYLNPLEMIDHPAASLKTYVKFYRQRWKDPTTGEELMNQYDLRFPGTKLTKRFGLFLKMADRAKIDELFFRCPFLPDLIKEDLVVVQKSSIRVREPWYKRLVRKRR